MKFRSSGAELHYEEAGQGPETIVFSHGLLWSHAMYERQVAALSSTYRCIAYDHRGQGGSEVTRSGYDMDTLAADAAELIERVGGRVHFVGLSMGGFVGLRLAARRPELIRSLALLNTAADPEPWKGRIKYRLMGAAARLFGLAPLSGAVMKVMFAPQFLRDPARAEDAAEMKRRLLANDKVGAVRATMGVVRRKGVADDELAKIRVPTLVLCGEHDAAIARARSQRMQRAIAGAELHVIPGAGHSSTVESPDAVTAELRQLFARASAR